MKRTTRLGWIGACLLTAVAVASPGRAEAQAERSRAELEGRVRQAFQNRIRQDLALTNPETRELAGVIQWSERERRVIAADARLLSQRITDFVRGGGTEEAARLLLSERANLQRREATLFEEEQERLLEVLTPLQVIRFYRIRDEFNARVQRLRNQRTGAARQDTAEVRPRGSGPGG